MEIISSIQNHWVEIGVFYLLVLNFLKGLRDAIDKTPLTDDNWFERLVSIMVKLSAYITVGKRPEVKQ